MGLMRCINAKHIDYDFMRGVFPNPLANYSDIDGVFERRGHFIFLEWKRTDEPLSEGQAIMLKRLSLLPKVTVLIVTGNTDNPEYPEIGGISQVRGNDIVLIGEGIETFKNKHRQWWERIERRYNGM